MEKTEKMTKTVGEKLLDEIERVVELRSQYEDLRQFKNVIVEPQIAIMTAGIEAAKKAIAENDAVACLAALQDLESWQA